MGDSPLRPPQSQSAHPSLFGHNFSFCAHFCRALGSAWIRLGFDLDSVWIQFGFGWGSVWIRFGFDLDSIWIQLGFDLDAVSIPLGFILDSISIRCMGLVSDVWDAISAIWN